MDVKITRRWMVDTNVMCLLYKRVEDRKWNLYEVKALDSIVSYNFWLGEFMENVMDIPNKRKHEEHYWEDSFDGYNDNNYRVIFEDGSCIEEWRYDLNNEDNTDLAEEYEKIGIHLQIIEDFSDIQVDVLLTIKHKDYDGSTTSNVRYRLEKDYTLEVIEELLDCDYGQDNWTIMFMKEFNLY